MTKPRLASGALSALAILFLLAGCSAPAAAPTPTRTPVAAPTPTPTPYLATITVNAENAVAADQSGQTLATLNYYGRGFDLAAQLTELFGFAPAVEVVAPFGSSFSGTIYDWEGFQLFWLFGFEDDPESGIGRYPDLRGNWIEVTVASVRGVAILGADGVQVGDGHGDLSSRYPDQTVSHEGDLIATAQISCVAHPEYQGNFEDLAPRNCITVSADPADGPVTLLLAPTSLDFPGY